MTPQLLGPDGKPLFGDLLPPARRPYFFAEPNPNAPGFWRVVSALDRYERVEINFLPYGRLAAQLAMQRNLEDL